MRASVYAVAGATGLTALVVVGKREAGSEYEGGGSVKAIKEVFDYADWITWLLACIFLLLFVGIAVIGLIENEPTAIEVFSARFDECMATEQFTREECIAYADEGE